MRIFLLSLVCSAADISWPEEWANLGAGTSWEKWLIWIVIGDFFQITTTIWRVFIQGVIINGDYFICWIFSRIPFLNQTRMKSLQFMSRKTVGFCWNAGCRVYYCEGFSWASIQHQIPELYLLTYFYASGFLRCWPPRIFFNNIWLGDFFWSEWNYPKNKNGKTFAEVLAVFLFHLQNSVRRLKSGICFSYRPNSSVKNWFFACFSVGPKWCLTGDHYMN